VNYSNDRSEAYHLTHTVWWASRSRAERRKYLLALNAVGRTWVFGHSSSLADVSLAEARELYNQNWDGCRDCWKENYRLNKNARSRPK
jgi:hypothetical protein